MIYLDSSWLVKLYADERDSSAVRARVDRETDPVVSDLSYVEVHSAIERRRREGSLTSSSAKALIARFRREWPLRSRLPVSDAVVRRAADLVTSHGLRALDAVHLASALVVASGSPVPVAFGASDARLVAAARSEGLAVAP